MSLKSLSGLTCAIFGEVDVRGFIPNSFKQIRNYKFHAFEAYLIILKVPFLYVVYLRLHSAYIEAT